MLEDINGSGMIKDLQLNDLVLNNDAPIRVDAITPDSAWHEGCCFEPKPIILTEEILKVNGFVSVSDNWNEETHEVLVSWRNGNIKITLAQESMRTFYDVDDGEELVSHLTYHDKHNYDLDIAIYYVHELQQALRLCGLNDLADNFKIE